MSDTLKLAAPKSRGAAVTMMVTSNSYDDVPYDSHPFVQTHPSRLATVATLFGMTPPPVESCRVLELGCASGGNLIPMAEALPGSQFVGVDYSARQIGDGQRVVVASKLPNVSLRHASILDIDEAYGKFDYIICHGVFSWVPDVVRNKILAVCSAHLTPSGVAYISYNTYPGWHMRGMIRDMMRYHAMRFDTAAQRIQQARALLDFIAESTKNDTGAYGTLLRAELENLSHQADPYLYHEHLEEVNDPLYFHQFAELAERRRLRYLGEARLTTMVSANFGPDVRKTLDTIAPDQVQAEQYLDFVRNRTFRETLLVPIDAKPNWAIQPQAIRGLHVTTPRRLVDDPGDVRSTDPVQYSTPNGMTISTTNPALKATLRILRERWPGSIPFAELERRVQEMLDAPSDGGQALALTLLNTYITTDLLELHAAPLQAVQAGERPTVLAAALARLSIGDPAVANRRHEIVRTNDIDRRIIPLLDGTRNRSQIVDDLTAMTLKGDLTVQREGKLLTDPPAIREALVQALEQTLKGLANSSLLVE